MGEGGGGPHSILAAAIPAAIIATTTALVLPLVLALSLLLVLHMCPPSLLCTRPPLSILCTHLPSHVPAFPLNLMCLPPSRAPAHPFVCLLSLSCARLPSCSCAPSLPLGPMCLLSWW